MKLNLGGGSVRIDGFQNVDILEGSDIVDDVRRLITIPSESCEAIVAHNILEHIAPDLTLLTLKLWVSKLKKGGTIEIGVPDAVLIFDRLIEGKNARGLPHIWEDYVHSLLGNMKLLREWHGKDAELYMHHMVFSKSYLTYLMSKVGLKNIKETKPNHRDNMTFVGTK